MDKQERIEQLKVALAAIDTAIAQVEASLESPATTHEDVLALRSRLINLQAKRSQLSTELINLQASEVVVPMASANLLAATPSRSKKLKAKGRRDLGATKDKLSSMIIDRSVIRATLAHAKRVDDLAEKIRKG